MKLSGRLSRMVLSVAFALLAGICSAQTQNPAEGKKPDPAGKPGEAPRNNQGDKGKEKNEKEQDKRDKKGVAEKTTVGETVSPVQASQSGNDKKNKQDRAGKVAKPEDNPMQALRREVMIQFSEASKRLDVLRHEVVAQLSETRERLTRLEKLTERKPPPYGLWFLGLAALVLVPLALLALVLRQQQRRLEQLARHPFLLTQWHELVQSVNSLAGRFGSDETLAQHVADRLLPHITEQLRQDLKTHHHEPALWALQQLTAKESTDLNALAKILETQVREILQLTTPEGTSWYGKATIRAVEERIVNLYNSGTTLARIQKSLNCQTASHAESLIAQLRADSATLQNIKSELPQVFDLPKYLKDLRLALQQARRHLPQPAIEHLPSLARDLDARLGELTGKLEQQNKDNVTLRNDSEALGTLLRRFGLPEGAHYVLPRVREILEQEQQLVERARALVPDAPCGYGAALDAIFAEIKKERQLNQQSREWADRVSDTLGVPRSDGTAAPEQRIQVVLGEHARPRLALRLGLLAALDAWMRTDLAGLQTSHADLVQELRLDTLEPKLRGLLNWAPSDSDEELANRILDGFRDGWLHKLLRADAILSTFFAADPALYSINMAVTQAAAAVRAAAHHFGTDIKRIPLLIPPPEGVPLSHHGAGGLPKIPAVRKAVLLRLAGNSGVRFVVDVTYWGYQPKNSPEYQGSVVVCNPSEWQLAETAAR